MKRPQSTSKRKPKLGLFRTRRDGRIEVRQLRRDHHGRIVMANGRFCYEWVTA